MSTLYRTRVYARFSVPLWPFQLFSVNEFGELKTVPGRNCTHMYVVSSDAFPYEFEGGPRWQTSREDGIKAAIVEVEAAAESIAALLADLRQQLVEETPRPLPAAAAAIHGRGESAAGGRDETPAADDRPFLPAGA